MGRSSGSLLQVQQGALHRRRQRYFQADLHHQKDHQTNGLQDDHGKERKLNAPKLFIITLFRRPL